MSGPQRIQLSRARGWRMPPNTVKVDRTTRWGNPFAVGQMVQAAPDLPLGVCFSAGEAVATYRAFLAHPAGAAMLAGVRAHLRGKNLACWCKPPKPGEPDICHAAVLLELANK